MHLFCVGFQKKNNMGFYQIRVSRSQNYLGAFIESVFIKRNSMSHSVSLQLNVHLQCVLHFRDVHETLKSETEDSGFQSETRPRRHHLYLIHQQNNEATCIVTENVSQTSFFLFPYSGIYFVLRLWVMIIILIKVAIQRFKAVCLANSLIVSLSTHRNPSSHSSLTKKNNNNDNNTV